MDSIFYLMISRSAFLMMHVECAVNLVTGTWRYKYETLIIHWHNISLKHCQEIPCLLSKL